MRGGLGSSSIVWTDTKCGLKILKQCCKTVGTKSQQVLSASFALCSCFLRVTSGIFLSRFVDKMFAQVRNSRGRFKRGRGERVPPIFCNHLFLPITLKKYKLINNNAPLIYVYPNTIETCLTPNYLFLADSYYNLLRQHQM